MIARAAAGAPTRPGTDVAVAVRSRHLLVAQAVGAALLRRRVSARVLPWVTRPQPQTDDFGDVVLALDELDSRAAVDSLCAFVRSSEIPVLVLAGRPEGAAWGGILDAGAAEVMPSATSLDEVERALRRVSASEPIMPAEARSALTSRWREWLTEQDLVEKRLASLSPRESSVLGMLAEGLTVVEIAARLGVTESTVRSHVKALRRKLRADSQLAAVATARRFAAGPDAGLAAVGPEVPRQR